MSSHTNPVACPNCHVSDQTDVARRISSSDEDGDAEYIHCALCNHLSLAPDSTDRYYESRQYVGEVVAIEDVPARARALMLEGEYYEEDIERQVKSFVDPEWLEWIESAEYAAAAASGS